MNRNKGSERLMLLLTAVLIAVCAVFFSADSILTEQTTGKTLDVPSKLNAGFADIAGVAANEVYSLPKLYHLPVDNSPAYVPNPECYYTETVDGITYDMYVDASITVKAWREVYDGSLVNLADVTISSPTQIRAAFGGGRYGGMRQVPLEQAINSNAVVAINADYYDYRTYGYIVRQGVLYRDVETVWDVLLIDDKGDFHVGTYDEIKSSGILDEITVINSFTFGPATVVNGEVCIKNPNPLPAEGSREPRTAVGQLGELHYLLATVDGRSESSEGLTIGGLAEVMQLHGCITAYNLDGGHSTAMVMNNKLYNQVAYGGQRLVSDILYFGTGIPN